MNIHRIKAGKPTSYRPRVKASATASWLDDFRVPTVTPLKSPRRLRAWTSPRRQWKDPYPKSPEGFDVVMRHNRLVYSHTIGMSYKTFRRFCADNGILEMDKKTRDYFFQTQELRDMGIFFTPTTDWVDVERKLVDSFDTLTDGRFSEIFLRRVQVLMDGGSGVFDLPIQSH